MNAKAEMVGQIELRLQELMQMFNSMDPSPFVSSDLDPDAEEFIIGWARELPRITEFELVIHLTNLPPAERAAGVEEAVRHYFASRAEQKRREFSQLMHRGRLSLVIGLACLILTLIAGGLVARSLPGTTGAVLRESLTIGGWVAMWRPMEIYLYSWWPIRQEMHLYRKLARMRVKLVLPRRATPPAG